MSETPTKRNYFPCWPASFRPSGPMLGLLALLVLFVFILAWRGQLRNFSSLGNIQVLLHKNSIIAVAALGMLLVIVSGGIDLSVGSVAALVTVVTIQTFRLFLNGTDGALPEGLAKWLRAGGMAWSGTGSQVWASIAALPAGILTGGLCGLCNGLIVTRLRVAPFVATLGMLSVARGLATWLANRTNVTFPPGPGGIDTRPGWVDSLARASSSALVFDPGVWSVVVLAVLVFMLLRFTVFGRYCYAIGSNEATARLCGIPTDRNKVAIYTLAGLFTGWAGVLMFAHGNGGNPTGAVGLELDVIAAVVIGGASLAGGQGTVVGTLLGVLILGVLENGVSFADVLVEVKYILIGAIVVINTALSQWQRKE